MTGVQQRNGLGIAGMVAAGLVLAAAVPLGGCAERTDAPIGSAAVRDEAPRARLVESGLAAVAAGDYATAEAQATTALRARADDPHALLALAMAYEATGRGELARQYYQVVRLLDPQSSVMIGNGAPQPVAELARAGLERLGGRPAVAPAVAERGPTEAARRFAVLRDLVARGLATEQEFALRRAANLGALLPYSEAPPAAGLDWPPPPAEQLAQRLRAIGEGLEGRSLTPAQHAAERQAILDALLPAQPRLRDAGPAPVLDARGLDDHLAWLQGLRAAGLIGAEELARERAAAERAGPAAAAAAPAAAAPQPLLQAPAAQPPAAQPPVAQPAAPVATPAAPAAGRAVHLASLRSEAAAREGWAGLRRKFPDLLGGLDAAFVRVDLPGRGVFWRINAGPLPDRPAAEALCRQLRARGQYCDPAPR